MDPDLQKRLGEVIGYKLDRAVTLHGIGATLFLRNLFPTPDTAEAKARYVSIMAGEEGNSLDMPRIRAEITALREALERYRSVVERFVSKDQLLRLSKQARQEALFL